MNMTRRTFLKGAAAAALLGKTSLARLRDRPRRPNLVVIMADDMGYSDIGCFGGAVRTPNLDRLADSGIRYTQFYNCSRCCPARAALLTGLYPHQAGMGWMTAVNMGIDGYEGNLNSECQTLAEVLGPAGYGTYVSGKWHVSNGSFRTDASVPDSRPWQRGFDRFFGMIGGAGSYFDPKSARYNDGPADCDPETFYYTDAVSEYACRFVDDHRRDRPDDPFLLYVAYTAPHWPLHAHRRDIDRYRGTFNKGWDVLRNEKIETLRGRGILERQWDLSARDGEVPAWESLSAAQREEFDLRMAIYAAQIDAMDQGIGRIMATLARHGFDDDTLVLFLSDNGGCHEEIHWRTPGLEKFGTVESFESYGRPWANCSNTPFRMFKSWVHEGGIATPLIAHWPAGIAVPGTLNHDPGHITDIMPTFIDLAGAEYPAGGAEGIHKLAGRSLRPSFSGRGHQRPRIFWEHEGNRAIRMGDWKLVAAGVDGPWELYDMRADRTEMHDLSARDPQRVKKMADQWDDIARATNVYPLDGRKWNERIEAFKKKRQP